MELSNEPAQPPVPVSWQEIYSSPIDALRNSLLDLSLHATPCRYRFFDCKAFVEQNKLIIYESGDLSDAPYTTISYTWRGNDTNLDDPSSPLYWKDILGTFRVKGGEDGDPISLDVLFHVCILSLRHATSRFVWLDRLCIMQTSKPDKHWQISKMNSIYQSCEMCCILPGGIRRLVRLEEETSWIHRGWTLQEAIVPKYTTVLYAWNHAMDGDVSVGGGFELTPIIAGQSAHTELFNLLQSSLLSSSLIPLIIDSVQIPLNFGIFGAGREFAATFPATALMEALASRNDDSAAVNRRYQHIWRSALLRTSSRPVDMVFSIMGLFGVSLDPGAFHSDDRLGATIALARGILQKGEEASWIGAAYAMDPCPRLCTFPEFPETSVNGKAYLHASDGSRKGVVEVMSDRIWSDRYFEECPGGSMDDERYLFMRARATRVSHTSTPTSPPTNTSDSEEDELEIQSQNRNGDYLEVETKTDIVYEEITLPAEDGSVWRIHDESATSNSAKEPTTYLVYFGQEVQTMSGAFPRSEDPQVVESVDCSRTCARQVS
ncbi:HET domain-containing protein [Mycena sanguinolenta]|uniref:HET domain-containing protein n=1 Tax=Mycena sanguinolenta TaxID=230812 RepID=A0A8H6Y958_9AGAR|nr:HET domain-containing protein [Mycena sanguinolenta]